MGKTTGEHFGHYAYSINSINVNSQNAEVLDINFGHNKLPLHILRRAAKDLIFAIIPEEELDQKDLSEQKLDDILKADDIHTLNCLLNGRVMILIGDFRSYFEYDNSGQTVDYIAGFTINGEIYDAKLFEYYLNKAPYEDLYASSNIEGASNKIKSLKH